MLFQMVGMQFHQTGDKKVTFKVFAGFGSALADIGNLAVTDQDGSQNNIVFQNDTGIGKGVLGHGFASFFGGWPRGCQL
ncbi:hypothetical protein D3C71_847140 [compost metagenome]